MIDTLLAFGCSNTFGAESVIDGDYVGEDCKQTSYPKYLADMLQIKNYSNHAVSGMSNMEIAKSALYYVREKLKEVDASKLFVVVGWTDYPRFPFYFNSVKDKTIFDEPWHATEAALLTQFDSNEAVKRGFKPNYAVEGILQNICRKFPYAEQFLKGVIMYLNGTPSMSTVNIYAKLAVTQYLELKNIKYLTLPTLSTPIIYSKDPVFKNLDFVRELEFLLNPKYNIFEFKHVDNEYKREFSLYGLFSGYGVSPIYGHLKADAHKKVAEFLFDEIKERKIL